MKRVQLIRHIASEAARFVGKIGELSVDIESKTLHLHDGATPGGVVLQSNESLAASFQKRNTVLDKLSNIALAGIVVNKNTTAGTVVIEGSTFVNVDNGDGQAGNPKISLKNLGANALTNGTAGGYDVGTAANQLPTVANVETMFNTLLDKCILIFHGKSDEVPNGWALCDGKNGTIDLSDKFIIGASKFDVDGVSKTNITGALTKSGGAKSNQSTAAGGHNHGGKTGGTAIDETQIPSHNHKMFATGDGGPGASGGKQPDGNSTVYVQATLGMDNNGYVMRSPNGAVAATLGKTSDVGGSQTHEHAIDAADNHTHETNVIPPYYALAFIQRIPE